MLRIPDAGPGRSHSGGKRAFLWPWNFMEEQVSRDEGQQDFAENGSHELGKSERPSSKFFPRSAGCSSPSSLSATRADLSPNYI